MNIVAIFLLFFLVSFSQVMADTPPPQAAADVGYLENTFSSTFQGDVDLEETRAQKYKWYINRFFGWKTTPAFNLEGARGGSFLIKSSHGYTIATAAPSKEKKNWVGTVFGGGGYFEAELKFNPNDVNALTSDGYPSFWAMAIEHMSNLPQEQWVGKPTGFVHFIEVDFFEYLFKKRNVYGGNIHDWFGVWRKTCAPKQFCKHSIPYKRVQKKMPLDTNFTQYHKYGFLWVPATKATNGWAKFFFDGKQIGEKETWSLYEGQLPSNKRQPWTFGILDRQHLVLILGSGVDQPLRVKSVNVWQKSKISNWVQ